MKKLILIGLLGVMITSCKKEYMCECESYFGDGNHAGTSQKVIKDSQKNALDKCADEEIDQVDGSFYRTCKLK